MQSEENILIQAGLSEEQAAVYDALLERGPQKATPLAKWTGIKRGLIYKVLEQLESKGLIEKKGGEGSVSIFSPVHPSSLISSMEHKERELSLAKDMLENSLGSLVSKYNLIAGKPHVRFYEGNEALRRITSDFPQNDTEIRQWIDISAALEQFGNETRKYLDERVKKEITKRMIVTDNEKNRAYTEKGSPLTNFRILRNISHLPTAIQTYDNRVSMLTLSKDKKVGLIIDDPAIAKTLQIIFDNMWGNLDEQITPAPHSSPDIS